MIYNVNQAFDSFNRSVVNLDPERTKKAKTSRDWLIENINSFPDQETTFPLLFPARHINFGSFSRNTKIRELDDVDLIICLHANHAYYLTDPYDANLYHIHTENAPDSLKLYSDNSILNSKKIVNAFVKQLTKVDNYKRAEIHRNQEAATLQLSSYEWTFDIVPSFYTTHNFYLIPDGNGSWKATNPGIDNGRVTRLNTKHNGRLNQTIRTLKFWNRHTAAKEIPSYLFECMVLNYSETTLNLSEYIDFNLINIWEYLKTATLNPVIDPKQIQGDLNSLTQEEKNAIYKKLQDTLLKARQAYDWEITHHDQPKAISTWRQIFGDQFPQHTGT